MQECVPAPPLAPCPCTCTVHALNSACCCSPCCLQLDVPEALHHLKPHPTNRRPACEAVMQQASSSAPMYSMVQGYTLQEPHNPSFLAGSSPSISASSCSSAPMPVPSGGGGGRCSSYMEGESANSPLPQPKCRERTGSADHQGCSQPCSTMPECQNRHLLPLARFVHCAIQYRLVLGGCACTSSYRPPDYHQQPTHPPNLQALVGPPHPRAALVLPMRPRL